ncbi:MAG: T9SS type A sorting domain-containing protein [Chitinophagaceae bacterium]|nr:T9SS type A sorting domain-containing protein [Chitinophagaceae bacterium]
MEALAGLMEAGYDSYISIAMAIAADDFNNTYITGYARGSNKDKSVTIKFSSAGVVQWTRIDSADYMLPYDIALDAGNNVIVFGERDLTMFVTKYDNSGIELWSTDFTALSGIDVWPLSMAIDQFDNILMLGASETGDYWENYNYTTVKYSPSGVLQWYADYDNSYDTNSEDKLQLAGFDSYGNVIVTGYTEDDASLDFFKVDVFKYEKGAVVTGIENPPSYTSVFPNPFHQTFQLELQGNEEYLTLELYNALGEMVLHKEISGRQAMINTGITSPGMYLAILKKDSKIISKFKMVAD